MCEQLLDVDVVIKLAAYDLLDAIAHPACSQDCAGLRGVTSSTRFVAASRLRKRASDVPGALARLEAFLAEAAEIEPTEHELALAAVVETEAANAGLELDSGESQLCAIAVHRGVPLILTGDKRAIAAAEVLYSVITALAGLAGRIACLEQAIVLAVDRLGAQDVRARVLAELGIDVAINICFQVTNLNVDASFEPSGLASYIDSVRASAPTVLIEGDRLVLPSVA